jgi:excisionase family DNA binding protein
MGHLNSTQANSEQLKREIYKAVNESLIELFKREKENYLTRDEVAKILKVNKSTISNWKKEGIINAYGLGGRVYFKRSEIDKAMIKIN